MTIRYLDLEGGNDANDGLSFANRKKTFANIGATVAAGDTVRIMASPSGSIGQGKWTSPDTINQWNTTGTITGVTNSVNATVTHNGILSFVPGDLVCFVGTVSAFMNTYWEVTAVNSSTSFVINNPTASGTTISSGSIYKSTYSAVKLSSPNISIVANSDPFRSGWTSGTVATTCTLGTTNTRGRGNIDTFTIASSTLGMYAYKTLPAPLDLSTFTHLTFSIQASVTTLIADSNWVLDLCSDAAGTAIVKTVVIPAVQGSVSYAHFLTLPAASNLGSNINSIALRRIAGTGTGTMYIGPIVATTVPGIGFNSIVSKSSSGLSTITSEPWMNVVNVDWTGSWWIFGKGGAGIGTPALAQYVGVSETAETYVHNPIVTSTNITSTSTAVHSPGTVSGTAENPITWSGGWNRTDMSTQDSDTWVGGGNSYGYGFSLGTNSYQNFENLGAHRFYVGVGMSNKSDSSLNMMAVGCAAYGIYINSTSVTSSNLNITMYNTNCCNTGGFYYANTTYIGSSIVFLTINNAVANTVGVYGTVLTQLDYCRNISSSSTTAIQNVGLIKQADLLKCNNSALVSGGAWPQEVRNANMVGNYYIVSRAVTTPAPHIIKSSTIDNFTTQLVTGAYQRNIHFIDCNFVGNPTLSTSSETPFVDNKLTWTNCNYTYPSGALNWTGRYYAQQNIRHTPSGYAWAINVTTAGLNEYLPLTMPLGRISCQANTPVTVSIWAYKDGSSMFGKLLCKGGQIEGVPNDVTDTITVGPTTWEQLSISFTPTVSGIVELEMDVWASGGASGNVYVDDLTIS